MANNFKFKIDIELPAGAVAALEKATEQAFRQVSYELDGRFQDAISSRAWPWPRQSKRGLSGSTVGERAKQWKKANFNTGSPRSIVDSGDLKDNHTFTVNGLTAEYVWGSEYAAAVHDGATIFPWGDPTNKAIRLPARPWTTAVLKGGTSADIEVYDFASELSKRIPKFLN